MKRKLYFVLPTVQAVTTVIDELKAAGIDAAHIVVATRKPQRQRIRGVHVQDSCTDPADRLEQTLWNLNLAVFFIAACAALLILVTQGLSYWMLVPLAILLASFIGGERFTHIPNTHLREFSAALRHGELVLMVSVPREQVADIENLVLRRRPDAALGGVGWSSDLLHV